MKKTLDVAMRMFNKEDVALHKRIKRVEDHLRFSSLD
jgi:hypothetical protein